MASITARIVVSLACAGTKFTRSGAPPAPFAAASTVATATPPSRMSAPETVSGPRGMIESWSVAVSPAVKYTSSEGATRLPGWGMSSRSKPATRTAPAAASLANTAITSPSPSVTGEASKPGVGAKARRTTALLEPSPEAPDVFVPKATT